METTKHNEMLSHIAALIAAETRRLNKLRDSGETITVENIQPIVIDDYREAFVDFDKDFLSDKLLNQKIKGFYANLYKLKQYYPEGSIVMLTAFPCDINGFPYNDEDNKNGQYLTTMFIDETTGLSTGFGALSPTTHTKLLPKEIQEKCSFKVHYDSKTPWADEKDFAKFSEQYTHAYRELQKLLKPNK